MAVPGSIPRRGDLRAGARRTRAFGAVAGSSSMRAGGDSSTAGDGDCSAETVCAGAGRRRVRRISAPPSAPPDPSARGQRRRRIGDRRPRPARRRLLASPRGSRRGLARSRRLRRQSVSGWGRWRRGSGCRLLGRRSLLGRRPLLGRGCRLFCHQCLATGPFGFSPRFRRLVLDRGIAGQPAHGADPAQGCRLAVVGLAPPHHVAVGRHQREPELPRWRLLHHKFRWHLNLPLTALPGTLPGRPSSCSRRRPTALLVAGAKPEPAEQRGEQVGWRGRTGRRGGGAPRGKARRAVLGGGVVDPQVS